MKYKTKLFYLFLCNMGLKNHFYNQENYFYLSQKIEIINSQFYFEFFQFKIAFKAVVVFLHIVTSFVNNIFQNVTVVSDFIH